MNELKNLQLIKKHIEDICCKIRNINSMLDSYDPIKSRVLQLTSNGYISCDNEHSLIFPSSAASYSNSKHSEYSAGFALAIVAHQEFTSIRNLLLSRFLPIVDKDSSSIIKLLPSLSIEHPNPTFLDEITVRATDQYDEEKHSYSFPFIISSLDYEANNGTIDPIDAICTLQAIIRASGVLSSLDENSVFIKTISSLADQQIEELTDSLGTTESFLRHQDQFNFSSNSYLNTSIIAEKLSEIDRKFNLLEKEVLS